MHKQKYPGRTHLVGELVVVGEDEFGVWLRPSGGDRIGVQLIPRERWWVVWWWLGWQDDAARRWLAADVCTPPILDGNGWHYDDLEIDVVGNPDGLVAVVDEDEFEEAGFPAEIAAAALRSRDEVSELIDTHAEPFGVQGWQRLDEVAP